jgi:hypothetical protein
MVSVMAPSVGTPTDVHLENPSGDADDWHILMCPHGAPLRELGPDGSRVTFQPSPELLADIQRDIETLGEGATIMIWLGALVAKDLDAGQTTPARD